MDIFLCRLEIMELFHLVDRSFYISQKLFLVLLTLMLLLHTGQIMTLLARAV